MRHSLFCSAFLAAIGAAPCTLAAEPLAHAGRVSLGIERVLALNHYWTDGRGGSEFNIVGIVPSYSIFSFLAGPRLAVDYFGLDNLSVGVSTSVMHYFPASGDESLTAILLNPRVGFGMQLSERIAFWPRAGLDCWVFSQSHSSGKTILNLSLEAQFVASPVDHLAILFGPTLETGLSGYEDSRKLNELALSAGLLGWF